ncbi:MAG: alpha/beta hydrolase [Clostridia bacterium]|nr:alpha/beta hydrolase [Clostridia bacterium]
MKTYKTEEGRKAVQESYDRLLKQWDTEVMELDIEGKYGSTHVVTAGDEKNPPLLLFHGVGDNSALMWTFNARGLSKKFRIYAIDAIGGPGKSLAGSGYGKKFSQTEWISELMDSLGIEKACAAGVSYGCYLVQHLKIYIPERIDKVVGMAGSISAEGSRGNGMRMIKAFFPEALLPSDKNVEKLINKLSGEFTSRLTGNTELMEHWKLLLRNFNNMSMGYHKIEKFKPLDFDKMKGSLRLLIGDMDILSYFPSSIDLLEKAGIDYKIVPGCGHSINHEKPDEINQMIIEFLL